MTMKKALWHSLFFGATFFLNVVSLFGQAVSVLAPTHSFGEIREGTKAQHIFSFTNKGQTPLTIRDVRASCGCTIPEWTRKGIPADSSGQIKVVFDSTGRPGPFSKSVVMTTTDGEEVFFGISGHVLPVSLQDKPRQGSFAFEHEKIDLGLIKELEGLEVSFLVQNFGTKPIKIIGVSSNGMPVNGIWEAQALFPQDLSHIRIRLTRAMGTSQGRLEIPILVETNDPDQPKKSLLITAEREGNGK
ncbi:MAG: DUF1573 domain-containing protein [Bacteroidetes Order II. Incertae sedis bacterium]|nr:DUF1573 domain-containing protein [Bacteroidetes Order II. bacterium]